MSGGLLVFGIFIFMAVVMLWANWYTKKHKTKLDAGQIIIAVFAVIMAALFFTIKNMGKREKALMIKDVALRSVVKAITGDAHKPYFKDMHLADGRYLPMPEAMNESLQIGDSIYKNAGDNFYTVINSKTKAATKYPVKIHERVWGRRE